MTAIVLSPAFSSGNQNSIELIFHPIPDAAYNISLECRINPSLVADGAENNPLHGGESHLLTILESCYCAADNLRKIPNSPYEKSYLTKLVASVVRDRDFHCPDTLGYSNGSRRRLDPRMVDLHPLDNNLVTYTGG